MRISVVIITYNEEANIADCLKSLYNQTRLADEIILVDDGSVDRTVAVASEFSGLRIIQTKRQERARARNRGWRESRGNIVVFAEADSVFAKNWLAEILKTLNSGADAVIDRRDMFFKKTFFQKTLSANFKLRYADYRPFSAWAFRREVLVRTGGFENNMICAEDTDLGQRTLAAGYKIKLAAKAFQYHKGEPKNFAQLARRSFIHNARRANGFLRRYPRRTPFVKIAVFLVFVLLAVLAPFGPAFFWGLVIFSLIMVVSIFGRIYLRDNGRRLIGLRYNLGLVAVRLVDNLAGVFGLFWGRFFSSFGQGRPDVKRS